MFSSIERVSIWELSLHLHELLSSFENRKVLTEIAELLCYDYREVDGCIDVVSHDELDSEFVYAKRYGIRLDPYICDDIIRLLLLSVDKFFLCSPEQELRGSSFFGECLDLPESMPTAQKFYRQNNFEPWFFLEYPTYLISTLVL